MKKIFFVLILGIALVMSKVGYTQTIAGSAHDFSTATWNQSGTFAGQICKVCHTPHKSDISVTNAPLWNHRLSDVATYDLYTSATMESTTGQPDESSKLCLSCHDGTVALENFGPKPSAGWAVGTNFVTGADLVGTDLRDDHPISFTYNTALATADGRLFDPSVQTTSLGGTIDNDMLRGGKMQCASCHDVHNRTAGTSHLLRIANTGSALCLTCHNK